MKHRFSAATGQTLPSFNAICGKSQITLGSRVLYRKLPLSIRVASTAVSHPSSDPVLHKRMPYLQIRSISNPFHSFFVSSSPTSRSSSSSSLLFSLRMKMSTSLPSNEEQSEKFFHSAEESSRNGIKTNDSVDSVPSRHGAQSSDQQDRDEKNVHRHHRRNAAAASSALSTMERASYARREIFDLWRKVCEWEEENITAERDDSPTDSFGDSTSPLAPTDGRSSQEQKGETRRKKQRQGKEKEEEEATRRYFALQHLLKKYSLGIRTPLEEDVGRGLGDALDRLILMCVPLPPLRYGGTLRSLKHEQEDKIQGEIKEEEEEEDPLGVLLQVLQIASRQGRRLTVRLVQHLFARTNSYAEALSVFYTLRRAHFAMNMETYHAMLYSLQRLEEEGWAKRFREEYLQRLESFTNAQKGVGGEADMENVEERSTQRGEREKESCKGISEQGLEFILRGVESPLLPENKPWIGQIMYGSDAGGREREEERTLGNRNSHGAATSTVAAQIRQTTKSWDELGELWVQRYKQRGGV